MKKIIDYIGIVVCDIDSMICFYENVLLGILIDCYVSEVFGVESEVVIFEVDGDRIELFVLTNNMIFLIVCFIK